MAKTWSETKPRFINPYNFVKLGDGVVRTEDQQTGELTGKIKCRLTVKTPLAIPDTNEDNNKKDEHKTFKFNRVGDVPVIPGSQLRGMIRSAYETLSDSCLSVNNVNILSARSPSHAAPGVIQYKYGRYHLYYAVKTKDKRRSGEKLKEGQVSRVWHEATKSFPVHFIFTTEYEEVECDDLDNAIKDYKTNVDIYLDNASYKKFFKDNNVKSFLNIKPDGNLYPVFFEIVTGDNGKKIVYLSPSQMGRKVFSNKVVDLLDTYESCSTRNDGLCKACSLFGIIKQKAKKGDTKAYASKLRFGDAEFVSDKFYSESVTLRELSSPKTTSVEFYSHRPKNAVTWSYDYKITDYKKVQMGRRSQTVPVTELCSVDLRGRKYYLHDPDLAKLSYSTEERTKRNSTMELAEAGNEFVFDIYFEKITQQQLHELVWTLAIGDNSKDSEQMYKLGHGKPLGLGSVKITVEDVETRNFDADTFEYTVNKQDFESMIIDNPFDETSGYFRDFMKITNFNTAKNDSGVRISYPLGSDGGNKANSNASHQWFIGNHCLKGTGTAPRIEHELPVITAKNLSLPKFVCENSGGGNFGGRNNNRGGGRSSGGNFNQKFGDFGTGGGIRIKPSRK